MTELDIAEKLDCMFCYYTSQRSHSFLNNNNAISISCEKPVGHENLPQK